jgi:hypothetical protein
MREKQSLTAQIVRRYQKAGKKEKTQILDEFIANTGYNRSYARRAIGVAKHRDFRSHKRIHRIRPHTYVPGVILKPLSKLWDISNYICGKRLAPLIPDYLYVLRRDHVWDYPVAIDDQLKTISAATIDRLLTPIRKKMTLKGRTTTKPETLLMSIPGIGERIVVTLINEIDDIHRFPSPKSLVAYAGLDPRVRQSGTALKHNTHITKRGSVYLRRDIFIGAVIASRWDSEMKTYYEKKMSEGKRHREAMVALSRKLLNRVYAVWKRGTPYERRLTQAVIINT